MTQTSFLTSSLLPPTAEQGQISDCLDSKSPKAFPCNLLPLKRMNERFISNPLGEPDYNKGTKDKERLRALQDNDPQTVPPASTTWGAW